MLTGRHSIDIRPLADLVGERQWLLNEPADMADMRSYTSFIGFNPRRLKGYNRDEIHRKGP